MLIVVLIIAVLLAGLFAYHTGYNDAMNYASAAAKVLHRREKREYQYRRWNRR